MGNLLKKIESISVKVDQDLLPPDLARFFERYGMSLKTEIPRNQDMQMPWIDFNRF